MPGGGWTLTLTCRSCKGAQTSEGDSRRACFAVFFRRGWFIPMGRFGPDGKAPICPGCFKRRERKLVIARAR